MFLTNLERSSSFAIMPLRQSLVGAQQIAEGIEETRQVAIRFLLFFNILQHLLHHIEKPFLVFFKSIIVIIPRIIIPRIIIPSPRVTMPRIVIDFQVTVDHFASQLIDFRLHILPTRMNHIFIGPQFAVIIRITRRINGKNPSLQILDKPHRNIIIPFIQLLFDDELFIATTSPMILIAGIFVLRAAISKQISVSLCKLGIRKKRRHMASHMKLPSCACNHMHRVILSRISQTPPQPNFLLTC